MRRSVIGWWVLGAFAATFFTHAALFAKSKKKKVYPEDKGPKTINVSKYPKQMQAYYRLFAKKCSKCHTLARPINSKKATEKDWKPYIDKMRKKPNSGISAADASRIYKFLVYDGYVRKLKKTPPKL